MKAAPAVSMTHTVTQPHVAPAAATAAARSPKAVATVPPAAPPAAPPSGNVRPSIAITTQTFALTGTGQAAATVAFTPLAWTVTSFTLTGTGQASPSSATPVSVAFTTDTIKLTGHP
jgi:hypothetical protein